MVRSINDLARHLAPLRGEFDCAIARVLSSGWFVLGPEVKAFEEAFAAYCGAPSCISVANGTDALELALRAMGIGAGSHVATVANAGMYSSVAIRAAGARAVFVDVDPRSSLLDIEQLAAAMKARRVDAVVATHLFGRMLDMPVLAALCREHGAWLVEDCAQAHGARWGRRHAGTFGDVGCFSFYPTKNLGALGDGGAIVCSDSALADRIRSLRQYGWKAKYRSEIEGGRNSRLDEMQAALLSIQLPQLDAWNARRRVIAAAYVAAIEHRDVQCPAPDVVVDERYVGHLFVVNTKRRQDLQRHLVANGVPHDVHYPVPDHRQNALRGWAEPAELRATEQSCRTVLTLPCFPEMTDEEVAQIASCVNAW